MAGGPAHGAMHEWERGMSISTRGPAVPYEAPRSPGFRRMFREGHLTLGLFFAIESYVTDMPTMAGQVELARKAEADGFAALWTRDVPLRDPTFGEVGQIFDPWVWRGYVTAHTSTIALATGAIVLPIIRCTWRRRPRPCTTCRRDGSCWGASGDRPIEFPAFGRDIEARVNFFTSRLHTCSPRCAKTRLVSN
jgi:hypothetical protein